jgi:hypothetical protein
MPHLEPSYIRYIYDGLEKGDLHPDNSAALPEGLIGLYDEAFDESKPARERQKLLETFAVWALLKKEVSAQFVAEILDVPTQEIIDFIATYSNWFTSPESGKYQLYHERLKVYLLQKLSEQEIAMLHNKLVTSLEQAHAEQKEDEFELYGLEFLSVHYFTTAMITGDGKKLIALSYDQNHWQRQLKLSKGFEWIKNGLKQVMNWASKFNDGEVIECGLQMVDLHHQEQNDAPQIVALVADGDIEAALKRIEAFGGNDKEGLERKFILYMLCLMELTLLESKDKPFRKEAIGKILKHFNENIPVDHSILNWDNFFSSYIMFQMACECAKFGLDYLILFARTDYWNINWLKDKGPCSYLQIKVLRGSSNIIKDHLKKTSALACISTEQYQQGQFEEAAQVMQEALICAQDITVVSDKGSALKFISTELVKQGQLEEALNYVRVINDKTYESFALKDISNELYEQDKYEDAALVLDEALSCARGISSEIDKSCVLASISSELYQLGQIEQASLIMHETFTCFHGISNESDKSFALVSISTELAKQGQYEKALDYVNVMNDEIDKNWALNDISNILAKKGQIEEAFACTRDISDDYLKCFALKEIYTVLAKQGQIKKALHLSQGLSNNKLKTSTLKNISTELAKQDLFKKAASVIKKVLYYYGGINDELLKNCAINDISIELAKKNQPNEGLISNNDISKNYRKSIPHNDISNEIYQQDKLEEDLKYIRAFDDGYPKNKALASISTKLNQQGQLAEAISLMQESIDGARSLSEGYSKNNSLLFISKELAKQGNWLLTEITALEIRRTSDRFSCWMDIAKGTLEKMGWKKAIITVDTFQNKEPKTHYLKGLVNNLSLLECNKQTLLSSYRYYLNDIKSLEKLLQLHALHETFFGNPSEEKIQRYNRTLQIQWAIDLKNELSN